MIDVHSHIVPGVDDGSKDLDESIQMVAIAAADGITHMVATPHADLRYKFSHERSLEELDRVRKAADPRVKLSLGCELHLTPENLGRALSCPTEYTLNGGDCILLELPESTGIEPVCAAVRLLQQRGLRVIIAHPERNLALQRYPHRIDDLVEEGAYLQVTAQAILGAFGEKAERTSDLLLKKGLVHIVASDAHGAESRRPILSAAYAKVLKDSSSATAETLFRENPAAALRSDPIRVPVVRRRSSLLQFFSRNDQRHRNVQATS
ncbi:MAG TPA: CpsB/CapC family capsule biosynthesis tyrosine phosphatase [Bryobacteraceae bacterium]|nr:CpsB/CapC family capsule biosynthesis tyrosine phosphatase [Bryobacteraceae bacterium]